MNTNNTTQTPTELEKTIQTLNTAINHIRVAEVEQKLLKEKLNYAILFLTHLTTGIENWNHTVKEIIPNLHHTPTWPALKESQVFLEKIKDGTY